VTRTFADRLSPSVTTAPRLYRSGKGCDETAVGPAAHCAGVSVKAGLASQGLDGHHQVHKFIAALRFG
jgi:hypothetical protein